MHTMHSGRQRGISLISTLVGMVLGLIAILSILSVYRGLVFRSTDIRANAKQDAQVSEGLIALNLYMQKAGYGIEATPSCLGSAISGPAAAANTDLVVVSGATLSAPLATSSTLSGTAQTISTTAAAGSAVIWRWIDPTQGSLCAGVVASQGTLSPKKGGGLIRLAPMSCTSATQWNALTWVTDYLIADDTLPPAVAAVAATATTPATPATMNKAVSFSALRGSCTLYGAGPAAPAVIVTVTAGNSTMNLTSSTALCLPNVCQ